MQYPDGCRDGLALESSSNRILWPGRGHRMAWYRHHLEVSRRGLATAPRPCNLCGASCSGIVREGPACLIPFSGFSLQIHILPLTWSDLAYRYTFPEVWPVLLQSDLRTARLVLSAPDFQAYDQ